MNLTKCIQQIYPEALLDVHFVPEIDSTGPFIAQWSYSQPKPTAQQLSAASQQVQAAQTVTNNENSLLENLSAVFSDFSVAGKGAFGGIYDEVVSHIKRGETVSAKIAVQMVEIPSEVPGVSAAELATWSAKKAEILALFP